MFNFIYGYKLIESLSMVDTKQAKTHHKKRINKKWRKRYGYISIPKKDVYIMSNSIIGHPETLKNIISQIQGDKYDRNY